MGKRGSSLAKNRVLKVSSIQPARHVKEKRYLVFSSRDNRMQQISFSLGYLFLVRHNYPVLTCCQLYRMCLWPPKILLLFSFYGEQAVWSSVSCSRKRSLFVQNTLLHFHIQRMINLSGCFSDPTHLHLFQVNCHSYQVKVAC